MSAHAPPDGEVTRLLSRWQDDGDEVSEELAELVYPALERIARRSLRSENQGHTLETRALVNEAYMRLVDQTRVDWRGRGQFFAIAARLMRRILVDHARRKHSHKRGGDAVKVPLEEEQIEGRQRSVDLIALDEALEKLAAQDEAKSRLVELRFFGGLTHEEIAEVLGVSLTTVERHWRSARAWLFATMSS